MGTLKSGKHHPVSEHSPTQELSTQQARILTLIETEIARKGRPPSLREIAHELGVKAVGTIQDHIKALERKGYIERDPGLSRGLRPTHHEAPSFQIPILGMVPAGSPIEALEDRAGSLSVAIPGPRGVRNLGEMYALKVKGQSMRDAGILDGDYVIVRKQSVARDGEIVVALVQGEVTVKELEKKEKGSRLLPRNPDFHPILLSAGDSIQGVVVSVQRYY